MEQRDEVIKRIRSICISTKEKMTVRQLNNDYRSFMGEPIPYQKLGFRNLEDLIQSSSDLRITRSGNDFCVTAQQSEKSAHMAELIAKQKNGKRKQPFRIRFTRGPLPPRMQQTTRWRPKTNFQTNRYQGSNRPQAVSHSQFVNKSPASKPSAPSVSSKVVIPEHSTYNSVQAQPQIASAAPVKRSFMNQRLTSNRLQENMKVLANNNTQNGHIASHIGTSLQSNNNSPPNQPKSVKIDIGETSTDPLVSTKKRLSKKISELSLERDSGNSSPTNDILPPSPSKTPDFIKAPDLFKAPDIPPVPAFTRTNDPLADLKRFAQLHKLGDVTVDMAHLNQKRKKLFSCKIKIGQKHTYSSYPNDFTNPLEAQTFCCEQALTDLIPKCRRKSMMMISSEQDILTRIPPMLEKHNHGIWAWQLKLDYADKFNELLSDDWLQIIDSSPCVQIEKMSEDYILYHCQPGDRGQQRGAGSKVPLSNVSIPANTVQFGEDGRLLGQVTCVVSANEIWCEQINTEESSAFAEMFGRMQIYYQEHKSQLVPDTILPAGYYIAKYEELYYRVRVLKVKDEDVNCFFIDYGDEIIVPKTDIFVLKREYATSQAQAFVCRLFGLEELYDVSVNSQTFSNLFDNPIELELALDVTSNENINDVLPVFMYDVETGESINEALIPKLTMELATPCLQPDGITEVYISNIESNGDIYVQVRSQGYETLSQLRTEIEEQVTAKPPKELLYRVTKSNSKEKLYFMKHNATGSWYRAKLIDWSPDGDHAQIYFVDEGHTDVIKVAEETLYPLEALNDVFNNYPYQAVRVRMALDVIPTNFVELASQAMPKDTPVLLKILRLTKDAISLVKLFRRNTDGGLFCINESVALQSELNKKEDDLKSKFKLPQISGSLDHVPSTGSLKCPPLPKLEDNDYLKVYVSVAVNPYNFFVQPYDSKHELDLMMEKLQERYMHVQYGNLKIDDIMPGSIYASKHEDGFWYRTSVIKVINSGASVSVFYCDFGYYQTLSLRQLFLLDEEFMKLPYQALKAKLAGIRPKHSKWTMEDCEQFKELIEKKLLFARLTDIEKDILYESDLVLKLFLVDTSRDDDVIIGKELVKSGIAVEE